MPTYTYPGVYIEEIPSGVRTITGVATSVTAFIGRALRGPTDTPVTIHSFADFERAFGGLWVESTMSYAVRDFYLNGGGEAIIVRIHRNATLGTVSLPTGQPAPDDVVPIEAASVGDWGDSLSVTIDYDTREPSNTNLFNLAVTDGAGNVERHLNVSIADADARYLPRVLEQTSSLIRVQRDGSGDWILPARPSVGTTAAGTTGDDGDAPQSGEYQGSQSAKTGLFALENADLFNLLSIPPPTRDGETAAAVYQTALTYCVERRAVLLVDSSLDWTRANVASEVDGLGLSGPAARNATVYFPRLLAPDPMRENQADSFVASGAMAGVIARTDAQRGVWKAPAGVDAAINGIQGLSISLTDGENGDLNPLGINCLRSFPVYGRIAWGARTRRGADQLADEYKYLPVRRVALFIEESLYRGTQWVVFEPNDEPLWAQIRLNIGAFMQNLFRQGAFQGSSPREAYFVKCDKETTTQNDINLGIVNIVVGFAPLKPAEFVVIKIQQMAGQVAA